jgi:hypothetical protein
MQERRLNGLDGSRRLKEKHKLKYEMSSRTSTSEAIIDKWNFKISLCLGGQLPPSQNRNAGVDRRSEFKKLTIRRSKK